MIAIGREFSATLSPSVVKIYLRIIEKKFWDCRKKKEKKKEKKKLTQLKQCIKRG